MGRIIRHLRILWRAESLLAEMRIANATKKIALFAGAGLVAAFGIAMLNFAAFLALQAAWGAPVAALLVALTDQLGAGLILAYALRAKPTNEAAMLREVRDMALQDLEAEAAGIEADIAKLRDHLQSFATQPLSALAPNALWPFVLSLLKSIVAGLRSNEKK